MTNKDNDKLNLEKINNIVISGIFVLGLGLFSAIGHDDNVCFILTVLMIILTIIYLILNKQDVML